MVKVAPSDGSNGAVGTLITGAFTAMDNEERYKVRDRFMSLARSTCPWVYPCLC